MCFRRKYKHKKFVAWQRNKIRKLKVYAIKMSETSEISNSGDERPYPLDKTIKIPTVETSEDEENLISFRQQVSSSEASDGEETLKDFLGNSSSSRPLHLLKRARRQAREFDKKGELELAVKERIRSLAYCRLVYGDGHWQLAKAYGKLGEAYLKRKGFTQQALLHATRGRDELLQGEAEEYRSTRLSHSNDVLAVMELVYYVMGKANFLMREFRKAEQAFKKAEISAKERLKFEDGKMSGMYVKIMECLGQVSVKLKKFEAGLEYYEKALKQAGKIYGKNGKEMIPLYQSLARAYKKGPDADHKKSVESIEKCVQIAEKNFGAQTTELADVLYGTTIDMQGIEEYDSTQSQTSLEQCLKIYKDNYGSDHKKTIETQEALCSVLIHEGEHDKAASIVRDVMISKMMVYGDPSLSLAESYQLLGTIRLSQGKMDKALKHFGKCQSMLSLVLGQNHKKTLQVTETLDMIKKTPGAMRFQSAADKLKDRPRFNGTVGRSSLLGSSTLSNY